MSLTFDLFCIILYRCVLAWRDITSFRTGHRKKMETFRAKHVLAKVGYEY
jgi:hypothetical protein